MPRRELGLGLIGLGTIAGGVAKVIQERGQTLAEQAGIMPVLRKVKVLPADLERPQARALGRSLLTTEDDEFWATPEIDVVVELIGGEHPALEYQEQALRAGKHVVTANKEVIAKHGVALLKMAGERGVHLRYEAAVGGGIPLIAPFRRDLVVNHVNGIYAIINGTTNYILSRMAQEKAGFAEVLAEAQRLGYAEANPHYDVEGIDAAYKLAILATLAFRSEVRPDQIFCEGISSLTARDFQNARELGYAIKLLAIAKQSGAGIEARVHPAFVASDSFLAQVNGVFNAVLVDGDLTGQVTFSGKGAGALPTSSAVVADILTIGHDIAAGAPPPAFFESLTHNVTPMADVVTRYYLRLNGADQPGVLAQIARTLGDHNISIASAIQKQTDIRAQIAEIVIVTHPAREQEMQHALGELRGLVGVREVGNIVRIED
ncbi:MAG: homoserine dehydrogenase [Dehalococcoidia bacterium]|nr:homoserine dehydrogenase [Dehalococcoidia bacterium]